MKVEFRKSFEKDLSKIRNQDLLVKIKGVIGEVENAESFLDVNNIKKLNANRSFYRIRVGLAISLLIESLPGQYRSDALLLPISEAVVSLAYLRKR